MTNPLVTLITGGASGTGAAATRRLLSQGCPAPPRAAPACLVVRVRWPVVRAY